MTTTNSIILYIFTYISSNYSMFYTFGDLDIRALGNVYKLNLRYCNKITDIKN